MADRYCQQFKASETADCLVAGHVLGLCWLYNRLPELQTSMSAHSWHRAFESRGRASARRNSQEAGQFAGHRGQERRFSSDEPSRGKNRKKVRTKERTELDKEGRRPALLHFFFGKQLLLWKLNVQSNKYRHTRQPSFPSAAFFSMNSNKRNIPKTISLYSPLVSLLSGV